MVTRSSLRASAPALVSLILGASLGSTIPLSLGVLARDGHRGDRSPARTVASGCRLPEYHGERHTLLRGEHRLSCTAFDLPTSVMPAAVTFAPEGGLGPDIGDWTPPSETRAR